MRISDWSSDVCSSDLGRHPGFGVQLFAELDLVGAGDMLVFVEILERLELVQGLLAEENPDQPELLRRREVEQRRPLGDLVAGGNVPALTAVAIGPVMEGAADIVADDLAADRSEEHTSELQSLMRISYAVFCF